MGEPWLLIGRDVELARIRALVVRPGGGLVIAGPAGVGRSRLGAEALVLAEANGAAVARVAGTRALSPIPLGVFAPLLPHTAFDSSPRVDDRAELLRRCSETLVAVAGGQRLVLLVDDAHLVDEVSASLLQQLVAAPSIFVIACIDTDEDPSEALVGLWKDDRVERIDLQGLDEPSVGQLLAVVLGAPVDPAAVRVFAETADGNIVFLRELVSSALEAKALRDDIGIWRLVEPLPSSNRIAELVRVRLEGLSPREHELVELLAFGEPLTLGELPEGSSSILEPLERRSLVHVSAVGRRLEVRLAHAVVGQVVRDRMPLLRARKVARQLGDAVEATGMRRRDDLLRVAAWRLDGGGSRPDLMLSAAQDARHRYDFDLAERLARRALHLASDFDAALLAAQMAGHQGRRQQAEGELEALARKAGSDREHALVAAARLDNLVFSLGHVDRGLELALEAEERIEESSWRHEITAKRSSVLAGVLGPRAALDVAAPVLDVADGRAFVWASLVASWAFGRLGELGRARELTLRGQIAHAGLEHPVDWSAARLVFFDAEALNHLGRMGEALRLVEATYDESVRDGSLEAQAWLAWQRCRFVAERGRSETAAKYGRLAVALFRNLGARQYEQFALGDLATAFAIGGHRRESRETLEFMDALGVSESQYFAVDLRRARAWTAAAHGDLPRAIELLRKGAEVGESIGDLVGAAASLHDVARLGTTHGLADELEALATKVEGPLVVARLDHVLALEAKDPVSLERVSASFLGFGAALLAAEAAADAAVAWGAIGEARRGAAAARLASELAEGSERPATPALSTARSSAKLTPAERTTALLAANGRTSRQIAEELVVSVRTVENHLQRVYEKLGIRGRAQLREAIGVGTELD